VLCHLIVAGGDAVLHAAAVETAGGVLAIAGLSGAGKTTLAGLLCASGAELVTDDALRIDLSEPDRPRCHTGTDILRLRQQAAELATTIPGPVATDTADGRIGLRRSVQRSSTLDLEAILLPSPSRDTEELTVARVGERDALHALLRCPRIGGWVEPDPVASHLDAAAKIVKAVAVYRATVPWGPPFKRGLGDELLAALELA
jgi:predicted kinase